MDLDNNFSNTFSLFQLESKSYRSKQCWPYIGYHIDLFWKFFVYKNLHIEPFNYAIKSICFDFCSANMGSSVIGTGRSEYFLLTYVYQFQCHYSLITYLRIEQIKANDKFHGKTSGFVYSEFVKTCDDLVIGPANKEVSNPGKARFGGLKSRGRCCSQNKEKLCHTLI